MAGIFDELVAATTDEAWAVSLPNVRGEGRERQYTSRDPDKLAAWSKRKDEAGYGQFFCVSTITPGERRKKEHAQELPFIFSDVDCKDIDLPPEEIEARLLALELVPSRIHATGNGYHCFWKLPEPMRLQDGDNLFKTEAFLKRLANHIGGDLQVAQVVALLRVPGTHNSKRGAWTPVRVIREGRETYAFDRLDAWVGTAREPVMVRRGRETNAFLRVAEEQSFRAPVDVEQRLQDMEFEGEGPRGVHATHLSVTASMCSAGMAEDDIVAVVMGYTQMLPGTQDWNWVQEERTLRAMIQDFERKLERKRRTEATRDIRGALGPLIQEEQERQVNEPPENVVSLSQARKDKKAKERPMDDIPKLSKKKHNEHEVLGRAILEKLKDLNRELMYTDNQAWMYDAGVWKMLSADDEKFWVGREVEEGCRTIGIVSTTKIVNETRAWLQRNPDIHQVKVPWDDHGCIATLNGTVDPDDGTIEPLQPEDFVTRAIDCRYDPEARCPIWEDMLKVDYKFDEGTIQFLQEFFGTILVNNKPRGLMRALVLLGPSNTGKSNILNVGAGLISDAHNTTPLQALEGAHGLMQFLKPNPWVLHEAFEQSRWEMSANAKALLSGDPVQVNIKNGAILSVTFKQPVLWGTNVPPQFKEASRAMENRLAILKMHRAFNPGRLTGTAKLAIDEGFRTPAELVLSKEKPGLLNWAIAGLQRAMARGHFEFTEEMKASLLAMRLDSNMVQGFMAECCDWDKDAYVNAADFNAAFSMWWRDHRGGQPPSADAVGKAMAALSDPRVCVGHKISHQRVYAGIKLNDEGLSCWGGWTANSVTGQRVSTGVDHVNKVLRAEQLHLGHFIAMQEAHDTWNPDGED